MIERRDTPRLNAAPATMVRETLRLTPASASHHMGEQLATLFPGAGLVQTQDSDFDVKKFAEAGYCTLTPWAHMHQQREWYWDNRSGPDAYDLNVWYMVEWEGHMLHLVSCGVPDSCGTSTVRWIVAPSQGLAEAFFQVVCSFNAPVNDEVLVFEEGYWQRSRELFLAIKGATLENLVLPGILKQDIHDDLKTFFKSRATYERFGVPWKRGVLLIGPPGNGKTHMVKALINALGCACLYVKSFSTEQGMSDQRSIRAVFHEARQQAPCVLVLEDLDSLIHDRNRSFFLNELDGFAQNTGIVALATTNHPERLDPAITNRPSRFDRKYHFALPALAERQRYLAMWNSTLQPALRLSDAGLCRAAEATDGFSFAYLKELVLSATMAWMSHARDGAMDEVLAAQAGLLQAQMVTGE